MSTQILDHLGIKVSDMDRAVAFYREALKTLGIGILMDFEVGGRHVGFGRDKPDFWISNGRSTRARRVAFRAASRSKCSLHAVAISVGGRTTRRASRYHPDYYGAFVLDPDGNNIGRCATVGSRAVTKTISSANIPAGASAARCAIMCAG